MENFHEVECTGVRALEKKKRKYSERAFTHYVGKTVIFIEYYYYSSKKSFIFALFLWNNAVYIMYVFMEILSKFCNRLLDITKLIIGIGGMRAEVGIKLGGGDLENF